MSTGISIFLLFLAFIALLNHLLDMPCYILMCHRNPPRTYYIHFWRIEENALFVSTLVRFLISLYVGNHDIQKKIALRLLKYVIFIFFAFTPEMLFCNVFFPVWSQSLPKTVVKDFTNPKFLLFVISKIICKTLNMRKRCSLLLLGKAHKCQTINST